MATNRQKFSSAGSRAIQNEFTRAIGPITDALEEVEKTVATLQDWWIGKSADKFVEVSENVKTKVEEELLKWLEANKNFMIELENLKFENDRYLASCISNVG